MTGQTFHRPHLWGCVAVCGRLKVPKQTTRTKIQAEYVYS